jgi:hypothetical protein
MQSASSPKPKFSALQLLKRRPSAASPPPHVTALIDSLGITRSDPLCPTPCPADILYRSLHRSKKMISIFVKVFVEHLLFAARHCDRDCPTFFFRPHPPTGNAFSTPNASPSADKSTAAAPEYALASKLPSILLTNARSLVKKNRHTQWPP